MKKLNLDSSWRFQAVEEPFGAIMQGHPEGAELEAYDDSAWVTLDLPHDYSITQPVTNGQVGIGNHNAGQNGYMPGWMVWYRKWVDMECLAGKRYLLQLDGSYRRTEVWVNEQFVGTQPNGYFSFALDITEALRPGRNLIAIRVNNLDTPNCRWYTGTGIYRHVWLLEMNEQHFAHWGLTVTTPDISDETATVAIRSEVEAKAGYTVRAKVLCPEGQVAAESQADGQGVGEVTQELVVAQPKRWTLEQPALYRVELELVVDGKTVDTASVPFGIRTIEYKPHVGFLLNGVPTKFKGVCLHHDAGPIGAAVPKTVWESRLRKLKSIGCNAIRTSHNPPSEEFLDACDEIGFVVMDEFCDKWEPPHFLDFATEWKRDMRDWIRRDRNHPCIVMWSVGNENDQPNTLYIRTRTKMLCDEVRRLDPTRVAMIALERGPDGPVDHAQLLLDSSTDTAFMGSNYAEQWYEQILEHDPEALILGTENYIYYSSQADFREALIEWNPYLDVLKDDRVMGQFLWTGIDYLGEAHRAWPNIGSSSGLIDMTGHIKPRARLFQSMWSEQPMVSVAIYENRAQKPRSMWDFPAIHQAWTLPVGSTADVVTYTNCQEVELLLNGQSLGKKGLADYANRILDWKVPFAPGKLEAVGYNDGVEAARFALQTPGIPASIRLTRTTQGESANGYDIAIFEAEVVDAQGVPCAALQQHPMRFSLQGPGVLAGTSNGSVSYHGPFQSDTVPVYHGYACIYVRSTHAPGTVQVTADLEGVTGSATVTFQ